MPKVKLSEIELDYVDVGSGSKTLLLLHGLGSTKNDWDNQIPEFSKYFRVLALDLRAHGNSSISKAYGVSYMAKDVKELLDLLKITEVTPVGFSMGGAVAFEFASSHPNLVDKLVIVNSSPDFNAMGKIGDDLLEQRTNFLKTKGLKALAKQVSYNMFPEPSQVMIRNEFEERCAANDYEAYYNSFVTLMDWGLGGKLNAVKHKTLVIASDMDYTPVTFKEEYVSRMHDAVLEVIANSRHGVVYDQAEVFNKTVLDFLLDE